MARRLNNRGGRRFSPRHKRGLNWTASTHEIDNDHGGAATSTAQGTDVILNAPDLSPGVERIEPEGSTVTRIRGQAQLNFFVSGSESSAVVRYWLAIIKAESPDTNFNPELPQFDLNDPTVLAQRDILWIHSGIAQFVGSFDLDRQQIEITNVTIDVKAQRKMRDEALWLIWQTTATLDSTPANGGVMQCFALLRTLVRMP